ncbi:hypothetical protein V8E55_001132 [Tylopilus felleus]
MVSPAAVLLDDDFAYLFQRLVERTGTSTSLGAWHFMTILRRLSQNHTKVLEKRFEEVRESWLLHCSTKKIRLEGWTVAHQRDILNAEKRATPEDKHP